MPKPIRREREQSRAAAYDLEIAPAVRAARAAGAGKTYGALAAALNDLGIPTMTGKRWTARAISTLLRRLRAGSPAFGGSPLPTSVSIIRAKWPD